MRLAPSPLLIAEAVFMAGLTGVVVAVPVTNWISWKALLQNWWTLGSFLVLLWLLWGFFKRCRDPFASTISFPASLRPRLVPGSSAGTVSVRCPSCGGPRPLEKGPRICGNLGFQMFPERPVDEEGSLRVWWRSAIGERRHWWNPVPYYYPADKESELLSLVRALGQEADGEGMPQSGAATPPE